MPYRASSTPRSSSRKPRADTRHGFSNPDIGPLQNAYLVELWFLGRMARPLFFERIASEWLSTLVDHKWA